MRAFVTSPVIAWTLMPPLSVCDESDDDSDENPSPPRECLESVCICVYASGVDEFSHYRVPGQ
jgi:hypothetical protein